MADTDIIVSEMTPASQINTDDLMIMTQPDAQAETGYTTKRGTVLQVANKMLKGTEYSTDLPDFTDKTPLGGLEELKADIKALLPIGSASGNPCNFSTDISDELVSLMAEIVCGGGGGTPSTPIPLVGHSELNLTRCGKNLLPLKFYKGLGYNVAVGTTFDTEEATDGTISGNTVSFNVGSWGRKCMLSPKLPSGVEFRLTMTVTSSATDLNYIEYYLDKDLKVTRKYNIQNSGTSRTVNAGFTLNDNECYIAIELGCSSSATIVFDSPMLNIGSTPLPYEPYNGQTFTVAFGQTVYGGVYDKSGRLTITHRKDLLSDMEWEYRGGFFRTLSIASDVKKPASQDTLTDSKCEIFTNVTWRNVGDNDNEYAILGPTGGELIIKCSSCSDLTAWATLIEGYSLVYELATPIEIDVQAISVSAENGVNNIVSDCLGDVNVQYRDSIQHYIDSKIASVQALIL